MNDYRFRRYIFNFFIIISEVSYEAIEYIDWATIKCTVGK